MAKANKRQRIKPKLTLFLKRNDPNDGISKRKTRMILDHFSKIEKRYGADYTYKLIDMWEDYHQ